MILVIYFRIVKCGFSSFFIFLLDVAQREREKKIFKLFTQYKRFHVDFSWNCFMYMLLLLKENVLKIQEKIDTRVIMKVNKNSKKSKFATFCNSHKEFISFTRKSNTKNNFSNKNKQNWRERFNCVRYCINKENMND